MQKPPTSVLFYLDTEGHHIWCRISHCGVMVIAIAFLLLQAAHCSFCCFQNYISNPNPTRSDKVIPVPIQSNFEASISSHFILYSKLLTAAFAASKTLEAAAHFNLPQLSLL